MRERDFSGDVHNIVLTGNSSRSEQIRTGAGLFNINLNYLSQNLSPSGNICILLSGLQGFTNYANTTEFDHITRIRYALTNPGNFFPLDLDEALASFYGVSRIFFRFDVENTCNITDIQRYQSDQYVEASVRHRGWRVNEGVTSNAFLIVDSSTQLLGIDKRKACDLSGLRSRLMNAARVQQLTIAGLRVSKRDPEDFYSIVSTSIGSEKNVAFERVRDGILLNLEESIEERIKAELLNNTLMAEVALLWLMENYEDEDATKNYYKYNPNKPTKFRYDATIQEELGRVKLDITRVNPNNHISNLLEFEPIKFEILGRTVSINSFYEIYIEREGEHFDIPIKWEETGTEKTYSYTFPLYQMITNTEEFKEWLNNPTEYSAHYFGNSIRSRQILRVSMGGWSEWTRGSYDLILYDSGEIEAPISYEYGLPLQASEDVKDNVVTYAESPAKKSIYVQDVLAVLRFIAEIPGLSEELRHLVESIADAVERMTTTSSIFGIEEAEFTYLPIGEHPAIEPNPGYVPSDEPLQPEPTPPTPGGHDIPIKDIIKPQPIPSQKTIGQDVHALYTIYKDDGDGINDLVLRLWSVSGLGIKDWLDELKELQNSPLENIISLKYSPWDFETFNRGTVMLGNCAFDGIVMDIVDNHYEEVINDDIVIPQLYGRFLDFAPYSEYDLYLPYVGYVPLDPNHILNKKLQLSVVIDKLTLIGKYQLIDMSLVNGEAANVLVGEWEFNAGADLPISATNFAQRMVQIAGDIVSTVVNPISAGANVVDALTTAQHTSTVGHPSANTSNLTNREAYIRITYPFYSDIVGFAHTNGLRCDLGLRLSDLSGFTRLSGSPDLSGVSCTQEEKDELLGILTSGFVIS